MKKLHLVIGDSHSHPQVPNDRFTWLANLISEVKPDVVVDVGDSADMASLFGADKGNPSVDFEKRRYQDDLDVYHDSRVRLHRGLVKLKGTRLVKVLGNHEFRIERWVRAVPKLLGHIGLDDLEDERWGWEVQPFLRPVMIDGIAYCHYFKRPGSGDQPVGGKIHNVIARYPGSFSRVFGHTHRYEYYEVPEGSGPKKITAINCGMYCDPTDKAHDWAGTDVHAWRSGILTLTVNRGQILGHRWYDYQEIKEDYS